MFSFLKGIFGEIFTLFTTEITKNIVYLDYEYAPYSLSKKDLLQRLHQFKY